MKKLSIFTLFISIVPLCIAQEEIIFNDINIDKNNIKVEQKISGIEFDINYLRFLPGQYMGFISGSVETHLNYFHENRLSNTITLYKSIGFGNAFYHVHEYNSNSNYSEYSIGKEVYQYILSLDLKIEPRWYFDQYLRYIHNKSIQKNTGWFLSTPIIITTDLLQQPVSGINSQWIPEYLNMNIITPPTLGYRKSIGKYCFMEISAGYIPFRAWYYNGSFTLKSANKIGAFSADSFNSELKIAYLL